MKLYPFIQEVTKAGTGKEVASKETGKRYTFEKKGLSYPEMIGRVATLCEQHDVVGVLLYSAKRMAINYY